MSLLMTQSAKVSFYNGTTLVEQNIVQLPGAGQDTMNKLMDACMAQTGPFAVTP